MSVQVVSCFLFLAAKNGWCFEGGAESRLPFWLTSLLLHSQHNITIAITITITNQDTLKMDATNQTGGISASESSIDTKDVLDDFTVFPNLRAELRLKIWKLALPDSRLVQLELWNSGETMSDFSARIRTLLHSSPQHLSRVASNIQELLP